MAERPKNILFLWTDEQRPDTIGAYGNPQIRTPHLDRLAETGTLFERAYCAQPVCTPSRGTVLTGLYPHAHGALINNMPLGRHVPTIAERLRPHGYVCGYAGKWHLGDELHAQRGFEDFWVSVEDNYTDPAADEYSSYHHFLVAQGFEPPDRRGGQGPFADRRIFKRSTAARLPEAASKPAFLAQEACRFLEQHGVQARDEGRGFCLYVNFLEPHMPFFGPLDGIYDPEQMTLPESWYREMEPTVPRRYREAREEYAHRNRHLNEHQAHLPPAQRRPLANDERGWKDVKARYWGLCTLVDRYVGRILDRLDQLGLADDTIVVYSTDHGDMMGEHRLVAKEVQYEGAVHVPLIVRAPFLAGSAARRVETPVSQVALVPTLLEALGMPAPPGLHGESLLPLMRRGATAPAEAELVIEWNGYSGRVPAENPGKLHPGDEHYRLGEVDARTIRRGRWKLNVHCSHEFELYDLAADPGELHNAFGDRGTGPVIHDLFERLQAWQRRTGDTLRLPAPQT